MRYHDWIRLATILLTFTNLIQGLTEPSVFNFASSVAGAKVLASSPGISTPQGCLDPDSDRYLLIERDNKIVQWLVIQLTEDITPKRIEIQNSEYYSTSPSLIEVSASAFWPTERWALIAELKVNKTRKVQYFDVDVDKVFRYLKLRIKAIQDPNRLCTLNSFKVFGIPALQPAISRLDAVDAGIEQLMSFSHRLPNLPQLGFLEKRQQGSCPVPSFSVSVLPQQPANADAIMAQLMQIDLNAVWDAEDARTSDGGSVYTTLMARLRSISLRQKLLHTNMQGVLDKSQVSLSNLRDRMTHLDRKVSFINFKQRKHIKKHSDLLQSSQLQGLCDLLSWAVPRLAERAEQFEKDLNSLIYLAVGAAISSAILLITLFYKI